MLEINVHERAGKKGRVHWQYDFRVTLPDGSIYRERRKARGATSEAHARRIGEVRLREVMRKGPPKGKKQPAEGAAEQKQATVAAFAEECVFYHWQRHLFEHGALAFGESRKRAESSREQQLLEENERLKARLAQKDAVIAEVTEELVKVKKSAGEP